MQEYLILEYVVYHFLKDVNGLRQACQKRYEHQIESKKSEWEPNGMIKDNREEQPRFYTQTINLYVDDYSREKQISTFNAYLQKLDQILANVPDVFVAIPETGNLIVYPLSECDFGYLSREAYLINRQPEVLQYEEARHNGWKEGQSAIDYITMRSSILQGVLDTATSCMTILKDSAFKDLQLDEWRFMDHSFLRNHAHEHYSQILPQSKSHFEQKHHIEEHAKACCNMRGDPVREILNAIATYRLIESV